MHINSWAQCQKTAAEFREENLVDPDEAWLTDLAQSELTLLFAFMEVGKKCSSLAVLEDKEAMDADGYPDVSEINRSFMMLCAQLMLSRSQLTILENAIQVIDPSDAMEEVDQSMETADVYPSSPNAIPTGDQMGISGQGDEWMGASYGVEQVMNTSSAEHNNRVHSDFFIIYVGANMSFGRGMVNMKRGRTRRGRRGTGLRFERGCYPSPVSLSSAQDVKSIKTVPRKCFNTCMFSCA
jgi:hypothetical protein